MKTGVKTPSFSTPMPSQCNLGSTAFLLCCYIVLALRFPLCLPEALCGMYRCTAEMYLSLTRVRALVASLDQLAIQVAALLGGCWMDSISVFPCVEPCKYVILLPLACNLNTMLPNPEQKYPWT